MCLRLWWRAFLPLLVGSVLPVGSALVLVVAAVLAALVPAATLLESFAETVSTAFFGSDTHTEVAAGASVAAPAQGEATRPTPRNMKPVSAANAAGLTIGALTLHPRFGRPHGQDEACPPCFAHGLRGQAQSTLEINRRLSSEACVPAVDFALPRASSDKRPCKAFCRESGSPCRRRRGSRGSA